MNLQGAALREGSIPEQCCFQGELESWKDRQQPLIEMHPETMRAEENILASLLSLPSIASQCLPLKEPGRQPILK